MVDFKEIMGMAEKYQPEISKFLRDIVAIQSFDGHEGDVILRIKEDSWNMQSASLAADDLKGLQQLTEKKKKLEELRRRKDLLHISLD